jgi:hypothetical protein
MFFFTVDIPVPSTFLNFYLHRKQNVREPLAAPPEYPERDRIRSEEINYFEIELVKW